MEQSVDIINTVGVPIFCMLAMGLFIYKAYQRITQRNEEREEKLYSMVEKSNSITSTAMENNAKMIAELKVIQTNINNINEDIEDIKTHLETKEE